jgi:hypothetical protein
MVVQRKVEFRLVPVEDHKAVVLFQGSNFALDGLFHTGRFLRRFKDNIAEKKVQLLQILIFTIC